MAPIPQNSISLPWRRAAWISLAIALASASSLAWGAPADFEVDPKAKDAKSNPNARSHFTLTIEQMESWAFQSAGQNRQGWIQHCEGGMKSRLAEIDATEPFSEQQRAALKLAMQGDI